MARYAYILLMALAFVVVPCRAQQKKAVGKKPKTAVAGKKTAAKKTAAKKTTTKKTVSKKASTKKKAAPQPSIKGLQNQRQQIKKKIRQQEQALKANKADVAKRLQNLMVINSEIEGRKKAIDGIQGDIDNLDGSISLLEAQLATLQGQLEQRKAKYANSVKHLRRRHGVQDRLMFIFSAKNFSQMLRRARFVKQYAAYQRAQGEAIAEKQRQVAKKQGQLRAARGHKDNLLRQGQKERAALQGRHDEQQKVVASLQKQQTTIQGIIADQKKKDAELNAQIDRLVAQEVERARARAAAEAKKKAEAEAARKKRAEELARKKAEAEAKARENERRIAEAKEREARLKEQARQAAIAEEKAKKEQAAADEKAQKQKAEAAEKAKRQKAEAEQAAREAEAERKAAELKAKKEEERSKKEMAKAKKEADNAEKMSAADRMVSGGFEANKGRLPMPITGQYSIVSHFGQYNVEGLKGVTLDNKGINILGKPGCQARSVYDGEVSAVFSYAGTTVVMVRHGAYISVYCNLASASVGKGQKVSAGQALGAVGADHILQFQLRRETAKLNPEAWLRR